MNISKVFPWVLTILFIGMLAGCSTTKSPAVDPAIRKSLSQAGFHDLSVSQDRDKGIVTLSGKVPTDALKAQAESLAKSMAGGQVVADEIAVLPDSAPADTKTLYADLDKGIQNNLDAAMIQNKIPGTIHHTAKNGAVTLSGTVDSEDARTQAQQVATSVPNVQHGLVP